MAGQTRRRPAAGCCPLLLALASCLLLAAPAASQQKQELQQLKQGGGFIGNYMDREDYEYCLQAMELSDREGGERDGRISREEDVDFARYMGPAGILQGVSTFDQLPAEFQDVFYGIACLCDPSGARDSPCCEGDSASIRIPGVSSVDDLSSEDRLYLYAACSNTKTVGEEYAAHMNETTPQSTPLWPVQPPPNPPPSPPTPRPATEEPTASPAAPPPDPTRGPTRPTRRPSRPTDSPTVEPSPGESPTEGPTREEAPTPEPAGEPREPTADPASAPSEPTPSAEPSRSAPPATSAPTPLGTDVARADARVGYFFAVPNDYLSGGGTDGAAAGGNSSTSDAMLSVLSDLQVAMNRLAPQITIHDSRDVEWEPHYREDREDDRHYYQPSEGRRAREAKRRRRLQALQVLLPTTFGDLTEVECATTWPDASATTCNWILAVIPLAIAGPNATSEATDAIVEDYQNRLSEAIAAGRLQDELLTVNPNTPVTVFTEQSAASPTQSPSNASRSASQPLSAGAISGIAIAAAVVMIPIVFFLFRSGKQKKKRDAEDKKPGTTMYTEEEEVGPSYLPGVDTPVDDDDDAEQPTSPPPPTAYESRAVPPMRPVPTPLPMYGEDEDEDEDDDPERQATTVLKYNPGDATLEDAGTNISVPDQEPSFESSQDDPVADLWAWSRSAEGTKSGPAEGSDAAAATGMSVAAAVAAAGAVGAAAATRRRMSRSRSRSRSTSRSRNEEEEKQPLLVDDDTGSQIMASDDEAMDSSAMSNAAEPSPQMQLESHIEAGDWAAVGATAALLAAASDSASGTTSASNSRAGRSRSFDGSAGQGDDARRAAELDRLVDKGDWDGLVAAASRYEASSSADGENNNNISTVSSPRTGSSASSGSVASGSDVGTGTIGSPSYESTASDSHGRSQRRNELRAEVEALVRRVVPEEIGNVDEMMEQFKGREEELVETLRNMQERSIAQKARAAKQKAAKVEARRSVQRGVVPGAKDVLSRTGDSESERGDEDAYAEGAAEAGDSPPGDRYSPNQSRTALEAAIDAGDWQAVGEAAALLSDHSMISGDSGELNVSGFSEGSGARVRSLGSIDAQRAEELDALVERRDWRAVMDAAKRYSEDSDFVKETPRGPSEEEQEALKQAELWRTFAEQMKPEATDEGASNAAEWAIQRSLSQLNESEKKKEPGGGTYEV